MAKISAINGAWKDAKTMKIALIGLGKAQLEYHLPVLLALNNCKITCVFDPDSTTVASVGALLNDKVHLYDNFERLVNNEVFDSAIVASPAEFHYKQSYHLIDRGVNVLCEKPISTDPSHIMELKSLVEKKNVNCFCLLQNRFKVNSIALKNAIVNGTIGKVHHVTISQIASNDIPRAEHFRHCFDQGGGILNDVGSHLIDLALWIQDYPFVTSASSSGSREASNSMISEGAASGPYFQSFDFSAGLLKLSNESSISYEFAYQGNIPGELRRMAVYGSTGTIIWPDFIGYRSGSDGLIPLEIVLDAIANPFEQQIIHYLSCIERHDVSYSLQQLDEMYVLVSALRALEMCSLHK
jgi:UDP-N-acetylglucosamine 3-dehydrogenase